MAVLPIVGWSDGLSMKILDDVQAVFWFKVLDPGLRLSGGSVREEWRLGGVTS